ncbi:hypothetical protein MNBD_GAMMA05-81 [hydrothermal vent metagenome]|uniref:Lipoprotein n=1 Tax=hydrothermal vent metagenome TaxID=652676 RepID=A0A3B0W7B8_9ZZZZ
MNKTTKTRMLILLFALTLAACSSAPAPKNNPYGDAGDQRSRAHQTQGELSKETHK